MYDMRKVVGNFAFIAIIIIIIAKFSSIFTTAAFPFSIVVSNSMEPTLHKGDIVPWIPCDMNEIKKGDIVVYKSASYFNQRKYIMHRVDRIIIKNGEKLLITRGDANNYTDQSGPHVPEPPVNKEMLQGKLITFGKNVIKIPYAGYPWILTTSLAKKLAAPLTWQRSQKQHFLIFTPFLFSFSLLLFLLVIWLPNGKNLHEKLHELIFGEERISISLIISYSIILFIPFLLFTSFFAFDEHKINEDAKEVPVFNPSWIKLRAVAFFEGKGKITPKIFDISGGEEKNIDLKNANGKIYVYSSPFWRLLPVNIMILFYNVSPRICIFLSSLVSAVILSIISSFALVLISLLWDNLVRAYAYSSFISLHYVKSRNKFIKFNIKGIIRRMKNMLVFVSYEGERNKRLFFSFLFYIPFSLFLLDGILNLFLIGILSSIIVSFFSYFIGIRFKNEVAFLSFFSSLFYSLLFMGREIMYIKDGFITKFIQFMAVSMLFSLILFIIMFFTMILILFLIKEIVERIDAVSSIEVGDI